MNKNEPIQITLPKLYPWQKSVITGLSEFWNNAVHVVRSKRQVGKSIMNELILIKTALEHKATKSYILEPTFAQSDKIFTEIRDLLKNSNLIAKENAVLKQLTFINGSIIRCFSAEQGDTNLRGYTVSGILIIDEAAYVSDEIINCVLPWVDANKAPILLTSTPYIQSGYFYRFDLLGNSGSPNVHSYCWNDFDTSELLSPEKLEFYRQNMTKDKFKTDYLGLYLANESAVFGEFGAILSKSYEETHNYFIGIDWSGGGQSDYTAISVFNDKKQMVDLVYFNDKDEADTITEIMKVIYKWNPRKVTVELNSIGRIYYGILDKTVRKAKVTTIVRGFNTTNESKDKIISKLQIAIQNKDVQLFPEEELVKELSNYEMTFSATGKRVFNGKKGTHDDLVMATAIALDSIESGQYTVSVV